MRIVTRLCLNRLRTLARHREEYVGERLPEPLLTSPDVAEDGELTESVSIAMRAVLETLTAWHSRVTGAIFPSTSRRRVTPQPELSESCSRSRYAGAGRSHE
ncbi:hypothetical protein AB0H57_08985 [Micromonospora sp. NPDC050686]|uniref:hypothetical protein n=1 Tax=Micromonospora sp. NPDC050686 TaxID=3154631 RepID=UPI0033C1714C